MKKTKNGWYQGIYHVVNKNKYMGDTLPVIRSSYEARFFTWLDKNEKVKRWGSEIIKIPYSFAIDEKIHNYIPDVYAEIEDKNGNIKKYLIEIKPKTQCFPPKQPKNKNQKAHRRYLMEAEMFIKNQNKWAFADKWCKSNGIIFTVITEDDLFGK